ncbi:MAG TPA: lysine--tRNA ligase [Acidobacteriota bacterium]|nr:lysine--tRNA ligase [Acidobacteriota bacterium]
MSEAPDHIEQRYLKLAQIQQLGHAAYPHKFERTHTIEGLVEEFGDVATEELETRSVKTRTAGRLVAIRGHGKVSFSHLGGGGKRLQLYVRQDRVGNENSELYRLLDVGDFVGIEGEMARTRTGELTIFVDQVFFLSKALLPLPEKWHGLSDVETRYRQRYLDLIANPEVRDIFVVRSRLISAIRRFLEEKGYLEVETPMMQPIAGGAVARPFKTFHEALGIPLFLRIAPELYLKRLVVGGFDRVFEINRNFRNEGISTQHNPEFTMLEFYEAYSDYRDLMDLTEEMLRRVVAEVTGGLEVEFRGQRISFDNFERLTMLESILKYWPDDQPPRADDLRDFDTIRELASRLGGNLEGDENWGKLVAMLFERIVEEQLIQPTFIYDFPVELSPLSKTKDEDPALVERFEFFAGGLELANAYSELNDPDEQRRRFQQQGEERDRGDLEAHEMDQDYVRALRYGMPPTAGEGIGIDRLNMILTNSSSIREVILFPHLRPVASTE